MFVGLHKCNSKKVEEREVSFLKNKEKKFSKQYWLPIVIIALVKRLEKQNNKKNKLQCSLANWLFLQKPVKREG